MSDILIKGMKMPQSCSKCPFAQEWVCVINRGLKRNIPENEVTTNYCPLIELPPHGRLIDADALVEDLKRQCEEVFKIDAVSPDDFWITRDEAYNERLWKTWCESFFEYINTRETVIPAEEEET